MASILDNILVDGALPSTIETEINTGINTSDVDIIKIPTDSLTLSGGYPIVFYTTGITTLKLPTSGILSTRHDNLGVFAKTTSAELNNIITDNTGSGHLVFSKSPVLTSPILGHAKASTLNGLAITNVTNSTLTFENGATLTVIGDAQVLGLNTGDTADVIVTAADVGLDQVDNTSDIDKPISTATQYMFDVLASRVLYGV